jgi:two-component system cell cycle response regulator
MSEPATILVVDDNDDNRGILSALLQARGYRVLEARDGPTALVLVERERPDVVLLDVMMPGMDGWEVCRTLKGHPTLGRTRVVMVTAKTAYEDKVEALRCGADDYLEKPLDLAEVERTIQRNLDRARREP